MKKKINILLAVAVLSLWGIVGYRTYNNYFKPQKSDVSGISSSGTDNTFKLMKKDTFSMALLARDPFMGSQVSESKTVAKAFYKKTEGVSKEARLVSRLPKLMPPIQYYGYIKTRESKKETAVIKIGQSLKRLKQGEAFEGIKIQKVFKDSIIVRYGETFKTYPRA